MNGQGVGHGRPMLPGGRQLTPIPEGGSGPRFFPNHMVSSAHAVGRASVPPPGLIEGVGGSSIEQYFDGPSNVYFFQRPGYYAVNTTTTYLDTGLNTWIGRYPSAAEASTNRVPSTTTNGGSSAATVDTLGRDSPPPQLSLAEAKQ